MITDYIKFAFETFMQRRKRTILTLLGIFIGIAAIVSLISLGQGLEKSVTEIFEQLGSDKIIMTPGVGSALAIPGSTGKFTDDDLKVIKRTRGIDLVAPMVSKLAQVKFGDQTLYSWVSGVPTDEGFEVFESMATFSIPQGRKLRNQDKYKTVIGIRLNEADYYDKEVLLRDSLVIEGQKFKVVGVMSRIGNPEDDSQLLIPLDTAQELFNEDGYVAIMAQVLTKDVAGVSERVKKNLRRHRNVKEGEEDFSVQTSEELMESFDTILTVVQAVLIGIAAISLFVGGIGIMNTMYTSVLQRTRIIGIMKAVGAKDSDILWIFVIESGILGLFGGVVGIAVGMGISKVVEMGAHQAGITFFKVFFPVELIAGALLFSFLVGVLSGISPAIRASKLKTVDVLRYE